MKKNIEQPEVMPLSYRHVPAPQFVFINSELICFSDGPTQGREPSC